MKKILSVALVIVMVLTAAPLSGFVGLELPDINWGISASAKDVPASGSCGSNVTYTYNSATKELIISGTGSISNYNSSGSSPFYHSDIKSVVVGDGITRIGDYSFVGCASLESVTIADTVTVIGADAFYDCTAIKNITLPNGLQSINNGVFYNCTSLESINIPDSVTTISWSAFYNCKSLESIIIPDSVTSIGNSAFSGCSGLKNITLSNSLTTIAYYTFSGCSSLESIMFPDSITKIGYYAFSDCTSLESIIFSDSLTIIEYNAFYKCTSLESVTIPDSVTSIDSSAFSNCTSLESVTIPDNVISIGSNAFYGGTMLMVNKDSFAHRWALNNNQAFALINPDAPEDNIISEVVNTKLSYSIDKLARTLTINNQGNMVTFSSYDAPWKQYSGYVFHVVIEDGCESISERAFYKMYYMQDITMPESIKSIGDNAFYDCDSLVSVTIPDSITSIGSQIFYDCKSLTSITIPNSVTTIGFEPFRKCTSLISVTIPDSVTSIGAQAFCECTSLKNVKIGNSVTYIGNKAFGDCISLTDLTMGDKIKEIETYAFLGCSSLEKVILPETVTLIKGAAFACENLKKIYIRSLNCSIAESAIYYRASIYGFNASNVKTFAETYGYNFVSLDIGDHEHEFTEWVPQPNATCENDGMMVRRCEICGEREEEVVPAIGHNYVETVVAPTCTVTGYSMHICANCNDRYDDSFTDALGHDFVYSNTVEPTCTNEGYGLYNCSRCGMDEYRDIVSPLGHDYVQGETVDPTCTQQGYTIYTCSRCNNSINSDFVGQIPHSDEDDDGVCDACDLRLQYRITENQTIRVAVKGGTITLIRFIPSLDGVATFTSISNSDTYAYLYDANMKQLNYNDDGGEGYNFYISRRMKAGEVYYLGVRYYNQNNSGSFEVRLDYIIDCDHETTEVIPAVEPTCEELGLTEGTICANCGQIVVVQQVVNALNHDFVEVSREDPTETESGFIKYACTRCGVSMIKNLPATDHLYAEIEYVEPTCDKDGYKKYQCTYDDCDETYTDVIPALGHVYGDWVVVREPSCVNIGMMMSACTRCELSKSRYLDATGHTVVTDEAVAPTCTEIGYTEGSHCVSCGEVFIEQYEISPFGHTEVIIPEIPATCTEDGSTEGRFCSVCKCIINEVEVIYPYGHYFEWDDEVSFFATCVADGYIRQFCSVCGEVEELILPAYGHQEIDIPSIEPTCTEFGFTVGKICMNCNFVTVDSLVLEPLGHDLEIIEGYEPTCEGVGLTDSSKCLRCGEIIQVAEEIDALGHDLIKEYVDATCIEAGYIRNWCTRCDYEYNEYFEVLPHNEIVIPAVAPTCTESGLTAGKQCSLCGEITVEQMNVEAIGHELGEYTITKEPTCNENGIKTAKCSRCSYTKTADVNKVPHKEEIINGSPADCVLSGVTDSKRCTLCGEYTVLPQQIEALGHDLVIYDGYYHCTRCDYKEELADDISLKITNFKLSSFTKYFYTFTWDECSDAEGYMIGRRDNQFGDPVEILSEISTNSYTLNLPSGWYSVRAYKLVDGEVVCGNWSHFIFGSCLPDETQNLKVHMQCNGIVLDWDENQYAQRYEVYQKNKNGNYQLIIDTEYSSVSLDSLTIGETYQFKVRGYFVDYDVKVYGNFSHSISFVFTPGNNHPSSNIVKGIDATCTTNGISDGRVCSICGTVVVQQQYTPPLGHIDADGDNYCDRENCNIYLATQCSCNCHKDGVQKMLFNFVLFFQKLFKLNKTCKCGAVHY